MHKIVLILSLRLLFVIVICGFSYSQQQTPDLVIPITTTFDNPPYPPPYVGDFFEIGLDSTATDSLDNHLGEYGLPPIPPPGYPSLLILPYNNFSGGIIDYKDFRYGELPYTGVKEHRIWFCSQCGTTISWNLPPGATGLLEDLFGGGIISIPMVGQDSFYVPYTFINELAIIVNYNNVIPVELYSFSALVLEGAIKLNWTTAAETNNSGFEIQRTSPLTKERVAKPGEVGRRLVLFRVLELQQNLNHIHLLMRMFH